MSLKYDQFYYNNQIHNYSDFWNLYDSNSRKAYEKYSGQIYCPLCHTAPLTIVCGSDKRYFRVSKNDMQLHSDNCSYKLDEASHYETSEFYKKATDKEICRRLQTCMNTLLKKAIQKQCENTYKNTASNERHTFLTIKNKAEKKVYLPHKFLCNKLSNHDIGIEKLFYGECYLYWLKNNNYNYLKILDKDFKEICGLNITESVFTYLSENIKKIPCAKEISEKYYICFIVNLEEKRKDGNRLFYNGTLRHSSHILIEKCLTNKNGH